VSYIYRGADLNADVAPGMILLYDKEDNHKFKYEGIKNRYGPCRNVLFYPDTVKRLSEEEFQEAIRKDNERRKVLGLKEKPAED
jgi:hypothetical protein